MHDNNDLSFDNVHKDFLGKCIQILFLCEIVELSTEALGVVSLLNGITVWISRITSIVMIGVFFKMGSANVRYRKASLFYGISVGGTILFSLLGKSMFAIVLLICSIIASYHELNAHSEMTAGMDNKLSKRWHSLFYLELTLGLLAGLLSIFPIIIATIAGADPNIITSITTICVTATSVGLNLLRVIYLKQTLALY